MSWSPTRILTWNSGYSAPSSIITDSNDYVHFVWYDSTRGDFDIYYKKGTVGGGFIYSTKRLTWTPRASFSACLAVDTNDVLHLVWKELFSSSSEIYYKKSTDGGSTWSSSVRLTWTTGYSNSPKIAIASNDHIHLIWWVSSSYETLLYKKSTDGGSTWTAAKRILWGAVWVEHPSLALDINDNIHVTWFGLVSGNYEILYKQSTDGGTTWSGTKRLTWTAGNSWNPEISTDTEADIHVFWHDQTPGVAEIFTKVSKNGSATWDATKRLTWNSGQSTDPAIKHDSNDNIHLVWVDNTSGNNEIYFKKGYKDIIIPIKK
jgi:hypothetical protein